MTALDLLDHYSVAVQQRDSFEVFVTDEDLNRHLKRVSHPAGAIRLPELRTVRFRDCTAEHSKRTHFLLESLFSHFLIISNKINYTHCSKSKDITE